MFHLFWPVGQCVHERFGQHVGLCVTKCVDLHLLACQQVCWPVSQPPTWLVCQLMSMSTCASLWAIVSSGASGRTSASVSPFVLISTTTTLSSSVLTNTLFSNSSNVLPSVSTSSTSSLSSSVSTSLLSFTSASVWPIVSTSTSAYLLASVSTSAKPLPRPVCC